MNMLRCGAANSHCMFYMRRSTGAHSHNRMYNFELVDLLTLLSYPELFRLTCMFLLVHSAPPLSQPGSVYVNSPNAGSCVYLTLRMLQSDIFNMAIFFL